MASRHKTTSVGTSATALVGTEFPNFIIQNKSGATVYLGGSDVSTSGATAGFQLVDGATFEPGVEASKSLTGVTNDRLYGIVASSTANVTVLVKGKVLS